MAKLTDAERIGAETSVLALAVLKVVDKLPVTIFAKFVGSLSAASSLGVSWITSIQDPGDREKMGVALASRMLDAADVLVAIGNGIDLQEAMKRAGQPHTQNAGVAGESEAGGNVALPAGDNRTK